MTTCLATTAPPVNILKTLQVGAKSVAKAKFRKRERAHASYVQQDTMPTMAATNASPAPLALPPIRYLMSAGLVLRGNTLLLNLGPVRTVFRPITPRILRDLV